MLKSYRRLTPQTMIDTASSFAPQLRGLESVTRYVTPPRPVGHVARVVGLTLEVEGMSGTLGDVCEIVTRDTITPLLKPGRLLAEVVGYRDGRLQLMPLSAMPAIEQGALVWNTGEPYAVPVGESLLGRVLDGLGNPIDDKGPLVVEGMRSLHAVPPHPLRRMDIEEPLPTGVKAIDSMLTLGVGQRVGVFAGSGVGKSTLLGMIARSAEADVNVIALIGERGREVREFIDQALGERGRRRSILVVATSEQSALSKIKASLTATAIAEYFRDQGARVMLMMDSLTRVAMAMREVGLSVGEPPAMRGYTPSMYAFMPRLVERAGASDRGSITGIYTVLVEGDDMNEPVADTVRGLLDGHFVLTRQLADKNHFPAIDVSASVSRLFAMLADDDHRRHVAQVRDWIATYRNAEDLISIGAYVPGTNPALDTAVAKKDEIDAFLRQDVNQAFSFQDTRRLLTLLAHTR